jgi:pilus assembly protein CpaB
MGRVRVFMVLALALSVGGVFAYATYNYVQNVPKPGPGVPTKLVVVAAADLDVGADLTRDDVRVIEWPANAAPAGAFSDPKEVVGRGLIMPVIQNEPIMPVKLASKDAGAGLPPAIPPGLRAVSVRVNEVIGVAGYVLPGTHVDVLAVVSPSDRHEEITSKVILTNVLVLAAGTKIERDERNNKPMAVSVVTLLVAPEEAERLTLASSEGKIQLALRNPLDKTTPNTAGIRPAALLGFGAPAKSAAQRTRVAANPVKAAAVAAPAVEGTSVEIIRGDKRAHEIVREEH